MDDQRRIRKLQRQGNASDDRVLRWLRVLEPLLGRRGPLAADEAEVWRRRLPALIARGELLRYRCGVDGGSSISEAAANLLGVAIEEARCLQAELSLLPLPPEGAGEAPRPAP